MKKFRIGTGFDVHRLSEGHKLIIGGVEIPHTRGCVGHSDADVLIHAICDAMLGALTLGDIGQHFPDNSDEFKGIDSRILLKKVNALISEEGYQIGNIDSTVVLQKPKIKDYIPKIQEEMASVLQVDVSQISVKVTTTEKLGFEGREEGVSAQAVCLLLRT
jgi:2-C-methyl-D-erythritol 2,4-cyclodiphosphate synthase